MDADNYRGHKLVTEEGTEFTRKDGSKVRAHRGFIYRVWSDIGVTCYNVRPGQALADVYAAIDMYEDDGVRFFDS